MKKIIIISVILIFGLFFGIIIYQYLTYADKNLKLEDYLDVYTDRINHKKGVIILNDSIVLHGNAYQHIQISGYAVVEKDTPYYRPKHLKYRPVLYDLEGPYRIIKKRGEDTLLVVKSRDTLYFKFVDPNAKDLDDPTLSDFLKNIFDPKG